MTEGDEKRMAADPVREAVHTDMKASTQIDKQMDRSVRWIGR